MQKRHTTLLFRMMLTAAGVAISSLATTSRHFAFVEDLNDKIEHILAFYVLGLLVDFSWPIAGFRAPKVLSLFGYGLAIEIVQYFLTRRTFSLFDLGADGMGLFLYALSVSAIKNIYPLSERFKASNTSGEQKARQDDLMRQIFTRARSPVSASPVILSRTVIIPC